ncbi:MAG: carboxypeptidase-like regulatory domain-containing protein, partial [Acidobacteriota bacterium]|nr:carboxypeptidase-like regulatory domain-containing protein [Acidobacteriota bacterium]
MTLDRRFVTSHTVMAVAVLIATSVTAAAQGGIRGLVRDNDGVGIGGATVTAESLESPATRTTTTNGVGRFAFIGLSRGDWLFVVTAEGFEPDQAASNV